MSLENTRAVIFDFDYTLADSSEGAFECINFALTEMGLARVTMDAACRTIGLSLHETFLSLGDHHEPHRCEEFHQLFVKRAADVMVGLTTLYEAVPEMIESLRKSDLKLGIVSTKYRWRIEEVLSRENVHHGFDIVIGGDDVKEHKPHPEGLLKALETLECSAESILYVGDSVVDAELATRAGVRLIVVLSGVTPREHFDNYTPVAVIDSIAELPALFNHRPLPGF